MTKEEMNNLGFYQKNPRTHPERWSNGQYENQDFIIPFLEGVDIKSLLSTMYDSGVEYGILLGKEQRSEEIKKLLGL